MSEDFEEALVQSYETFRQQAILHSKEVQPLVDQLIEMFDGKSNAAVLTSLAIMLAFIIPDKGSLPFAFFALQNVATNTANKIGNGPFTVVPPDEVLQ